MAEHQARKDTPIYSGVHRYFPAALAGVARVSLHGSRQHHGNDSLYDDRAKSNDDADCLLRHLRDSEIGDGMDGDVPHIAKVAWRALRLAQKWYEARGAALAPAARSPAYGELIPHEVAKAIMRDLKPDDDEGAIPAQVAMEHAP